MGREDGQAYIVRDFVEGVPLSSWLTAGQLTSREASQLCAKVAEALHHAREAGVGPEACKDDLNKLEDRFDRKLSEFKDEIIRILTSSLRTFTTMSLVPIKKRFNSSKTD